VEVVVTQAVLGQTVDVRGIDQTAEAPEMREAGVVQQEDDDVGRAGRGLRAGRPPLLGVLVTLGDLAPELLPVLPEGIVCSVGWRRDQHGDDAKECDGARHDVAPVVAVADGPVLAQGVYCK
jgi:hypothetical protein